MSPRSKDAAIPTVILRLLEWLVSDECCALDDAELIAYRKRFPALEECVHLISHSLGCVPAQAKEDLEGLGVLVSLDTPAKDIDANGVLTERGNRLRRRLPSSPSRLANTQAETIAVLPPTNAPAINTGQ